MKVFLDANILFSAAMKGSLVNKTITAISRELVLVTSAYAYEEARRNLTRKAPAALAELELLCAHIARYDQTAAIPDVQLPDKDKPILGAAIAAGCVRLVTGDMRHFKTMFGREISGVKILSLASFIQELDEAGMLPPI
jgi:predicted nucleic acid-binding protein